jgi:hypothetical protein
VVLTQCFGLQNRCEQRPCSGGFDSRPPPLAAWQSYWLGRTSLAATKEPHPGDRAVRIQQSTRHSSTIITLTGRLDHAAAAHRVGWAARP